MFKLKLMSRPILADIVVMLVAVYCIEPHAHALTQAGSIGDLRFTVYAPDWTWQKRDINILVVLENGGVEPVDVSLDLVLPPGKEDHFAFDKPTHIDVSVPSGETVRHAYTDIRALDNVPRQTYEFEIRLSLAGREIGVAYPVRTIRGAMVNPGKWALFAPAAVALAWCVVFAVVVSRLAVRGAWRRPGRRVAEPEKTDSWIDMEPTE